MQQDSYSNRFGGIANLYSNESLLKLKKSDICIIGIGGVGSWAAEALARSGVGTITLIDLDDICVTNTNRQIHAQTETYGKLKTEVMRDRILSINPDCLVEIIDDFLTLDNIEQYISKKFDYVIDAIDNARIKSGLIAYCKRNKIKVVTTGAAGGKTDISQIKLVDLNFTVQDPLLARVRRILKQQYKLHPSSKNKFDVYAVYSSEQVKINTSTECTATGRISCNNGLGTMITVTATFGFYAASRVINYLINK